METLKARPNSVSNVQIANSIKLGARKTRKQNIHGLVVGIMVFLNRVVGRKIRGLDYRPNICAFSLEVGSHTDFPKGVIRAIEQGNSRVSIHDRQKWFSNRLGY